MISVRMFTGATYLLVHPLLAEIKTIVIDREFEGWENEIRSLLLRLIRQAGHEIRSDAIQFRSVGKHARCHHLALAAFRNKNEPDHRVTLNELLAAC